MIKTPLCAEKNVSNYVRKRKATQKLRRKQKLTFAVEQQQQQNVFATLERWQEAMMKKKKKVKTLFGRRRRGAATTTAAAAAATITDALSWWGRAPLLCDASVRAHEHTRRRPLMCSTYSPLSTHTRARLRKRTSAPSSLGSILSRRRRHRPRHLR